MSSFGRWLLFGAVALASTALVEREARADFGPKFDETGFVSLGLNTSYSMHPRPISNGFVFGGEASVGYLNMGRAFWVGAYSDVLRDFGADATRFSVGPELGFAIVGLDGGYVGDYRDGKYHHGFSMRLQLTLVIFSLYGRGGKIFGDPLESGFGEIGFLYKIPIPFLEHNPPRPPWIEPPPPPPPPPPPAPPGMALPPGEVAVPRPPSP
jgi:hypothetical protein